MLVLAATFGLSVGSSSSCSEKLPKECTFGQDILSVETAKKIGHEKLENAQFEDAVLCYTFIAEQSPEGLTQNAYRRATDIIRELPGFQKTLEYSVCSKGVYYTGSLNECTSFADAAEQASNVVPRDGKWIIADLYELAGLDMYLGLLEKKNRIGGKVDVFLAADRMRTAVAYSSPLDKKLLLTVAQAWYQEDLNDNHSYNSLIAVNRELKALQADGGSSPAP